LRPRAHPLRRNDASALSFLQAEKSKNDGYGELKLHETGPVQEAGDRLSASLYDGPYAKAKQQEEVRVNAGSTHHKISRGPSSKSSAEQVPPTVNTMRSEHWRICRTQGMSPRAIASPYAGHSGLTAIATNIERSANMRCGMAYSGTAAAPRVRAMMKLSAEKATATAICKMKKSPPRLAILEIESRETNLQRGRRSGRAIAK
jgi:hypothetical protein